MKSNGTGKKKIKISVLEKSRYKGITEKFGLHLDQKKTHSFFLYSPRSLCGTY